jgi:hypothetical protein
MPKGGTGHPSHPIQGVQLDAMAAPVEGGLGRRRWSNKNLALGILAGMAFMALIGVVLSLGTQEIRRTHDAGLPKDRTLPLYLSVFVVIWVIGLAVVAVRELQARHQRGGAGGVGPLSPQGANVPRSEEPRLPLGYVVATIGLIALSGLAVTMLAVQISAQRASRPALDRDETPVRVVAPARLEGLGYLPPDSDLIAGVHVAEAFQDPLAREFLVKMSFRIGKSDVGLHSIQQWTGLKLRDIDHIVLGLRLKSLLFPRMTLVVRTRRPYDAEAVRKALQASPAPEPDKKELYKITLGESVLDRVAAAWLADSTTLVFGLSTTDFKPVLTTPREGVDHLAPDLCALLSERMSLGTPAWVVGSPESWEKSGAWNWLARQTKDDPAVKLLARVRALGVWFQFGDELTVSATFECRDAATAKVLEKVVTGTEPNRSPLKLATPRPALQPIFKELGGTLKSNRDGNWLALQMKASAETMRGAFDE